MRWLGTYKESVHAGQVEKKGHELVQDSRRLVNDPLEACRVGRGVPLPMAIVISRTCVTSGSRSESFLLSLSSTSSSSSP